jgi:hypothetical protein
MYVFLDGFTFSFQKIHLENNFVLISNECVYVCVCVWKRERQTDRQVIIFFSTESCLLVPLDGNMFLRQKVNILIALITHGSAPSLVLVQLLEMKLSNSHLASEGPHLDSLQQYRK